ncbi:MAG: TRAM domain-containing protein, partial [Lachnospiraceae bacterium]|nr:TRAM domain-containing protein [Lachnospiraceae bacterium]
MSLEKNQEFEITIEDMGNEGEGIGHLDGMAVFVKDTVPGDVARIKIIKVKKNYAYGRLIQVICPSDYRVEPICPHARRCGGCTIMHVSYEKQLAWKQDKVKNCLQRIGGIADIEEKMEPIIGMEYGGSAMEPDVGMECGESAGADISKENKDVKDFPAIRYRNKAQFPVRRDKAGRLAIGFYAGRTHSVIDTDICYLQDEVNDEIIRRLRCFMEKYQVEAYDVSLVHIS